MEDICWADKNNRAVRHLYAEPPGSFCSGYLLCFRQTWLPTVQDVLQADWQEVWHSPQPRSVWFCCRVPLCSVRICFKAKTSFLESIPEVWECPRYPVAGRFRCSRIRAGVVTFTCVLVQDMFHWPAACPVGVGFLCSGAQPGPGMRMGGAHFSRCYYTCCGHPGQGMFFSSTANPFPPAPPPGRPARSGGRGCLGWPRRLPAGGLAGFPRPAAPVALRAGRRSPGRSPGWPKT